LAVRIFFNDFVAQALVNLGSKHNILHGRMIPAFTLK